MKIGEKKTTTKGKWTFTVERTKFDWKTALALIAVIGILVWFFNFRK